ncbi:MAG: tRNA lysidine(34) synthetase TilS, partial [Phycisphaerae bacterium]
LRAEQSDADEKFVIEQAEGLGIEVITKKINVTAIAHSSKLSIETAARQLRIESLIDIAHQAGCGLIAAGHQKNDNAETIIHRILRGTGLRGLGGIWPQRKLQNFVFVRPMLDVTRKQILEYLDSRKLKWRLDATNEQCLYKRNFIRHKIIPQIEKKSGGSITEQLSALCIASRKFHLKIARQADSIWPELAKITSNTVSLSIDRFLSQPEPVELELIRRCLNEWKIGERDFTEQHYKNLITLARTNKSNKIIELPGGIKAYRQYNELILTTQIIVTKIINPPAMPVELNITGETLFEDYIARASVFKFNQSAFKKFKSEKDSYIEWFDLDKISLPIIIRTRSQGDRFIPLGQNAPKKIGQFLTDAKIPADVRKQTVIIADDSRIIWVCPIRTSQAAKITSRTKKILQLNVAKKQ